MRGLRGVAAALLGLVILLGSLMLVMFINSARTTLPDPESLVSVEGRVQRWDMRYSEPRRRGLLTVWVQLEGQPSVVALPGRSRQELERLVESQPQGSALALWVPRTHVVVPPSGAPQIQPGAVAYRLRSPHGVRWDAEAALKDARDARLGFAFAALATAAGMILPIYGFLYLLGLVKRQTF